MTLRIPARSSRSTLIVLGSRFLAQATPASCDDDGRRVRDALRGEFPDATHHCWGMSLRTPAGERALSDDAGEPAGTAGTPILQAIRRAGVTNVIVVVTRWFGGTKLGKGGLARAYRETARAALDAAGAVEVTPMMRLRFEGPVEADGAVRHLLARRSGRVLAASYDDAGVARLLVEAPEAERASMEDDLARLTRGAWRTIDAARDSRDG
jgi:putative IMPACT (imprinted ancient) family translation regulator